MQIVRKTKRNRSFYAEHVSQRDAENLEQPHRIADLNVLRQARQWFKARVSRKEQGSRDEVRYPTPQGGDVSLLLANIYRHYVLGL